MNIFGGALSPSTYSTFKKMLSVHKKIINSTQIKINIMSYHYPGFEHCHLSLLFPTQC